MRLKPEIARTMTASALLGAVASAALFGLTGCSSAPKTARPHQGGRPVESAEPGGSVDLGQWITGFTDRITQSGGYRIPGASDRRAIADGVRLVLDGKQPEAERSLATVGYTLRTLVDRDGGMEVAEIADATKDGEARRGWGRIYVDLRGPARWSVQVPHPTADQRTEQLGIGLLRSSPGGVLVLAGAHRNAAADGEEGDAADVAHRSDSVFAAVSDTLADRRLPAVQVHGFADSSSPGHDVVVSPGKGDAGLPAARRLSNALRKLHLRSCEVWQRDCGRLEGRTNVEGDHADAVDVPFVHVEHSRRVRDDDRLLAQAVRALTEVTKRWSTGRR
ncbi:hypothetical protein WEB32_26200 [Streptomyces netropsis]|uniref:N-acetylmuramoyl-L-alanine amidase n=1 Tax=Streptomyces netropsis TaxID=55404 RepID=A0A7W7PGG8_STRNE|nr:hypothetical protein [Streptomyces netropsis]MBB4889956.1 hypothetical protein [Streptomyces netropsis]GGR42927.1 hypothetical protein GCM10010219_55580 [Streptomyces netropsis]